MHQHCNVDFPYCGERNDLCVLFLLVEAGERGHDISSLIQKNSKEYIIE